MEVAVQDRRPVAVRVGIAVSAAVLAVLALAQGGAQVATSSAPAAALAVAPWFAPAHARTAELALVEKDARTARQEAMTALRRDATLVPALRTLGQMDEGSRGDRLLVLSLRLSRRDLPTHITLLQRDAAAGNLDAVLLHYGQALRTNQRSWPLLLPGLAKAAADPSLIEPLANEIVKRPQWVFPFYREWVKSSPDTRSMVALSRAVERRGQPLNRDVRVGLLARLIDAQDWTSLRDELTRARPPCGADACIDGGFSRFGLLQPVDWTPAADNRALVVRAPVAGGHYALDYAFTGPGEAIIARRLLLLRPGRYVLSHAMAGGTAIGKVGLALECADASGATLSDPSRVQGPAGITRATVPASCPAQWVTLRVASDDGQPVSGRLVRVDLVGAPDDAR